MKKLFPVVLICVCILVSLSAVASPDNGFGQCDQIILLVLDGADPAQFSLNGFELEGISKAVFPTMTKPGHTSLLTGVYPSHHGILANEYNDNQKTKTYTADMIKTKTLFEILKENGKKGIFISGKKGLAAFLGPKANLYVSPAQYPLYLDAPGTSPEEITHWVFDAIIEINKRENPDFICANVPTIDDLGHEYGPKSKETAAVIALVQNLVYDLQKSLNTSSTLIITADHGMSPVSKAVPIHALLRMEGYETWPLHVGRCAFLYNIEEGVREFALQQKGVKEIIEPQQYPDYHIDHETAPDIILTAKEGYLFIPEPLLKYYKGMHGSLDEQETPFYMTGNGVPTGYTECNQVDITPLIVYMLSLETDTQFAGNIPEIKEKKASGYAILVLLGVALYIVYGLRTH